MTDASTPPDEQLLSSVVRAVLSDAECVCSAAEEGERRALVSDPSTGRSAVLRVTSSWLAVEAVELGVGALDVDEDERTRGETLTELADLARRYLRGEGEVVARRRLGRTTRTLTLTTDRAVWRLRRRSHSVEPLGPR